MYYVASLAWIIVTVINWNYGNRKIPIVIGILGLLTQVGIWVFGLGYWGVSAVAALTVIGMFAVPDVFIRNKV